MSAEGKKKRGISGQSNARNIPFRYGGKPSNLSTRIGGTNHPRLGGSKFLYAMIFGRYLPNFTASDRAFKAADEVIIYLEDRYCGPRV